MFAIPELVVEAALRAAGCRLLAGVDEVGRGSWAGPVYAGAVVLPEECYLDRSLLADVTDSKLLTPAQRRRLDAAIRRCAVTVGVGRVEAPVIDRLGIVAATRLAMRRAITQVTRVVWPQRLLVDAIRLPEVQLPHDSLIKGDRRCLCIAAASIVAKVARDVEMARRARRHPAFGFERNRGYGTLEHFEALWRHGLTPLHRRSFAPMKYLLGVRDYVAGLLPDRGW